MSRQPLEPSPPSDLEIARRAPLEPILALAETRLGLVAEELIPYGHHRAKLSRGLLERLQGRPRGRLVLVSAITPTPAGEGKTTTCVGLVDALSRLGVSAMACLREPSLGPVFGMKGGAAGGGYAQVVPMEAINLHFNGDLHAVTAAHNLLAALLDNHLYWGNALGIEPARVTWPRVLDLNDRSLRRVRIGLGEEGGQSPRGEEREARFEITAASEVMAILCLAEDLADLQRRLGRIVVAWRRDDTPVTAADLGAVGPMAVLLRDAMAPNLVQTLEHTPVLMHGGPFANIAHGCSSLVATRAALALSEVVVTEAGFGADQGLEKFIDITSRQSGLYPEAAVIVVTLRALRCHGGADREAMARPDAAAVERGLENLVRQVEVARRFGLAPVVALNAFPGDSEAERELLARCCDELGVPLAHCEHWARGERGRWRWPGWCSASWSRVRRWRHSIPMTLPWRRRWKPSPPGSMGPAVSSSRPRPGRCSSAWSAPATAGCRSVSPGPSTASRMIRQTAAWCAATGCVSASCASRPAPASWWRSAAS